MCWNNVKRWSVEIKPMRLELQINTDPMAGVNLDTGFPKALALLRHMVIKETGS